MAQSSRERTIKLYVGAFILLVTGMGSILAANIVVSTSSRGQEFGQGEYRIKACDTWVTLDLIQGATGESGAPEGFSPLTGIAIQGLNASQCTNTKFQIGVLDSSGISLPIFRTDGLKQMCGLSDCIQDPQAAQQLSISIDAQGVASLSTPDQFHNLNFDAQTGEYRVLFNQPGILANDVSRLTIQSQGV
ncbi:hypothetical protein MCEMRE22_01029 [Candidatus Nanopelagicaceae bacterium]